MRGSERVAESKTDGCACKAARATATGVGARNGFAQVQSRSEPSAEAFTRRMPRARSVNWRREMKIEVLYFPGCPNYLPAVERIEKVLASESLRVEVRSIAVSSDAEARERMVPGSPTIRVDGEDVEPDQTVTPALKCRVYAGLSGVPSEEMLRLALSRAKGKG